MSLGKEQIKCFPITKTRVQTGAALYIQTSMVEVIIAFMAISKFMVRGRENLGRGEGNKLALTGMTSSSHYCLFSHDCFSELVNESSKVCNEIPKVHFHSYRLIFMASSDLSVLLIIQ